MQKSFSVFSSKLFFFEKNWSQNDIYTLEFLKMGYGKTRVTSYELQVKNFKAQFEIQKCEFKSTSYECKSTSYEFKSMS